MLKIPTIHFSPRDSITQQNDKEEPVEIPVPDKNPEVQPPFEQPPITWPTKDPEINPEKEPVTIPPPPSQIPVPSEEI